MEVRFVTHINARRDREYKVRLGASETTTVKTVLSSWGVSGDVIRCTVDFIHDGNINSHKPISILEDVALKVQIDAAGAAIDGLDMSSVVPTLNVYLNDFDPDGIVVSEVNRRTSNGKRERSPPNTNGNTNVNVNGNGDTNIGAPLTGLGKSGRGGGARRGPARNRRRSHLEAAAAIAAEAKMGRYNTSNNNGIGNGTGERTAKQTRRENTAVEKRRLNIPASSSDGMATGMELYIVPNTFPAAKLTYAQSTMYCALCGSLAAERAAFIAPRAEKAFENLFSATAIILAAAPRSSEKLALNPLSHLTRENINITDSDNNNTSRNNSNSNNSTSNINRSRNDGIINVPNKAIYSLKNSPILPFAPIASSINAGPLWTLSKLRKDISKLAKVVDILFA